MVHSYGFAAICEVYIEEGCGAVVAIGAASFGNLLTEAAPHAEKSRPNGVALDPRLVATQDTSAALLSLLNIAQCLEHDL